MKYITDTKYSHILKLLQSTVEDDVKIGVELLDHSELTNEELLWMIPTLMTNDPRRDIKGNLDLPASIPLRTTLILECNSGWVSIFKNRNYE